MAVPVKFFLPDRDLNGHEHHQWIRVGEENLMLHSLSDDRSAGPHFLFAPARQGRNSGTIHIVAVEKGEIAEVTYCGRKVGTLQDKWGTGEHLCVVCSCDKMGPKTRKVFKAMLTSGVGGLPRMHDPWAWEALRGVAPDGWLCDAYTYCGFRYERDEMDDAYRCTHTYARENREYRCYRRATHDNLCYWCAQARNKIDLFVSSPDVDDHTRPVLVKEKKIPYPLLMEQSLSAEEGLDSLRSRLDLPSFGEDARGIVPSYTVTDARTRYKVTQQCLKTDLRSIARSLNMPLEERNHKLRRDMEKQLIWRLEDALSLARKMISLARDIEAHFPEGPDHYCFECKDKIFSLAILFFS